MCLSSQCSYLLSVWELFLSLSPAFSRLNKPVSFNLSLQVLVFLHLCLFSLLSPGVPPALPRTGQYSSWGLTSIYENYSLCLAKSTPVYAFHRGVCFFCCCCNNMTFLTHASPQALDFLLKALRNCTRLRMELLPLLGPKCWTLAPSPASRPSFSLSSGIPRSQYPLTQEMGDKKTSTLQTCSLFSVNKNLFQI